MQSFRSAPAEAPLEPWEKGIPGNAGTIRLEDVAAQGWRLLNEDLPLPVAVLKVATLRANSLWMKRFLADHGCRIAPHGKTTLSPALYHLQMDDGAWGITLSTPHHLHVARRFGFKRIILANQLVGRSGIEWVVDQLNEDPDFDFYCLLDSAENLAQLAAVARRRGLLRPLKVLLELGFAGGRTGCRTVEQAMALARQAQAYRDVIALSGIEGFEGLIRGPTMEETRMRLDIFLNDMVALATQCDKEGLFAEGLVLITAGGSAFFDIVVAALGAITLSRAHLLLLRSGCYLTHDSLMYTKAFEYLKARDPGLSERQGELQPALEVWGYVQSRPEPTRLIAAIGKRDVSHDQMPAPLSWYRPDGSMAAPVAAPENHRVVGLNDQHCMMDVPEDTPWRVGDMVGFGISHPCLTFDKWRVLHLVDDDYAVVGSIRTYF